MYFPDYFYFYLKYLKIKIKNTIKLFVVLIQFYFITIVFNLSIYQNILIGEA